MQMKRKLRKIMSVLIVLTLLLSLGGVFATNFEDTPRMEFEDVSPDNWFYQHVVNGLRFGIIKGVGDGRFEPNRSVTRAEFITMLGRLHEYGNETIGTPGVGAFYERYLDWAVEKGIIHGNQYGDLMPHVFVTREQMAVIVVRYVEVLQLQESLRVERTNPYFLGVIEWEDASCWAQCAIGAFESFSLIFVNPEFSILDFRPRDYTLRAEAVRVIERIGRRIY